MSVAGVLGDENRHLSDLKRFVDWLDQHRMSTGSFVVRGKHESELTTLALKILQSEGPRNVISELVDQVSTQPDEDWVCRPSLTVKREPQSLRAMFVPRDRRRKGVFLPYVMYAYTKLTLLFLSKPVQDELRAFGYDPSGLAMPAMLQVVGGARDRKGALGRERTISFSARVNYDEKRMDCNVVFGLPLLATRPHWNDRNQAVQFKVEGFVLDKPIGLTAANTQVEWQRPAGPGLQKSAGPELFCQTHKAVLISEKGIVYEEIDVRKTDRPVCFCLPGGSAEIYAPMDLISFENIVDMLRKVRPMFSNNPDFEKGIRLDGLLIKETRKDEWGKLVTVGVSPVW